MMADTCIGIFARAPVPGQVKTRIAATLGDNAAAHIYTQLLSRTLMQAADTGLPLFLWGCGDDLVALQHQASRWDARFSMQRGDDLGQRMCHALAVMHEQFARVLLIGSDCLLLDAEHLLHAAASLQHNDCVLTSAEDGGYVLIGSAQSALWSPSRLTGVRWGTEFALQDTLDCLHAAGARVTIPAQLWDVDTAADVERAVSLGLLDWPGQR